MFDINSTTKPMRQIWLKIFWMPFLLFCHYFPLYLLGEKNVTFLVLYVIGIIKPLGNKTHSTLSDLFSTVQTLCWQQAQWIVLLIMDIASAEESRNYDLVRQTINLEFTNRLRTFWNVMEYILGICVHFSEGRVHTVHYSLKIIYDGQGIHDYLYDQLCLLVCTKGFPWRQDLQF